jgi:hypothetical protein
VSNAIYPATLKGIQPNVVKTPEFKTVVQASPSGVETRLAQAQNPIWHWQLFYEFLFNDTVDPVGGSQRNPSVLPYSELQTLMGFYLARQGKFDSFLFTDPEDYTVGSAASPQPLQLIVDNSQPISAAAIGSSAGTGFAAGDQLAVIGGGGTGAVLQVATLSGSAIATFSIVSAGSGYTTTTGAALVVLTGSGSGSPTANITVTPIYYTPLQRNLGGEFLEDVTDIPLRGGLSLLGPGDANQIFANGVQKLNAYCYPGSNDFTVSGPGLAIPGYSFAGLYLQWHYAPTPPITGNFQFYFRVRFEDDKQDFERFLYNLWTVGGAESQHGSGIVRLMSARTASL